MLSNLLRQSSNAGRTLIQKRTIITPKPYNSASPLDNLMTGIPVMAGFFGLMGILFAFNPWHVRADMAKTYEEKYQKGN
jgi:hypothetical protein